MSSMGQFQLLFKFVREVNGKEQNANVQAVIERCKVFLHQETEKFSTLMESAFFKCIDKTEEQFQGFLNCLLIF